MSDNDRLLHSIHQQRRTLSDGCTNCGHSKVYCRAVQWLDTTPCCSHCSGH